MRASRWLKQRRAPRIPLAPVEVEVLAADAVRRALPEVEALQVHAIDNAAWRQGAEAMRDAVLDVLRAEFPGCSCHPVYHQLGVHAPVGDSRPVTP